MMIARTSSIDVPVGVWYKIDLNNMHWCNWLVMQVAVTLIWVYFVHLDCSHYRIGSNHCARIDYNSHQNSFHLEYGN